MTARKEVERLEARRLRSKGWTLRRIAIELGVSIASVSVWVRDLAPTRSADEGSRTGSQDLAVPKDSADAGLRRCASCREDLPLAAFNRHGAGHQWWCRECFRGYFRARGDLHRKQTHEAQQRRRREARALLAKHLSVHPCVVCAESDPVVLEFDHLGPKRGNVSFLAGGGLSAKALLREIAVCEVVCANCHRRRTASNDGSWRLNPGSLEQSTSLLTGEARNLAFVRDLLLESCCVDRGLTDLVVLEFDHIANKHANVTQLARRGCSLDRLKKEIAKCEGRCANCHRRRTFKNARSKPEAA
jgi:hypothetical protein